MTTVDPQEQLGQYTPKETDDNSAQVRTYGENNSDLPEQLQNALRDLLYEAQRQDLYQRRQEILRDRKNRFYERGLQHITELLNGAFAISVPGQVAPDPANPGQEIQCGQFLDAYNIFGRSLLIIVAKITENPPGIVFEPDSGDSTMDQQAADAARVYQQVYERYNDLKDLFTAIVRIMGLSGRTVAWTRTVADEQRWGKDIHGQPQRRQTTTIYGTLENKVPILARSISDCPYLIITEDPHVYNAKMQHPDFADKISEEGGQSTSDTEFERLARIGALQGQTATFEISDSYTYYVEDRFCWFRPSMFVAKMLDSPYTDKGGTAQTLREALQECFPDGCHCEFIGEVYVGSRNEVMDDHLAIDFPYPGEGMSRRAVMDDAVPIQEAFNDFMNNVRDVMTVGWPSTWIDEDVANLASINDTTAFAYAYRAMKSQLPRDGHMSMSDRFYREPDPNIPATFMQFIEYMTTQLLQFILAIPSAVQGAGMPDQKTKGGYQEAIYQAMGQLGVIFGAVQRMYSKIIRQAALAASRDAEDGDQTIIVPGPQGAAPLKMSAIAGGTFLAHPDTDSGYPESMSQKRVTIQTIFELGAKIPQIAEALLASPDNWSEFLKIMGFAGLTIPEATVRDKQEAEIEILLQQSPTPGALDPMTGQPTPGQSSIPPGPLDYHEWEFEECKEWLSNWSKRQAQIAAGNEAGVQNVLLHAQEHQALMQQQQMQQAMAQAALAPPPKPGAEGPPQ